MSTIRISREFLKRNLKQGGPDPFPFRNRSTLVALEQGVRDARQLRGLLDPTGATVAVGGRGMDILSANVGGVHLFAFGCRLYVATDITGMYCLTQQKQS